MGFAFQLVKENAEKCKDLALPEEEMQIWLNKAISIAPPATPSSNPFEFLEKPSVELNEILSKSPFLTGSKITFADIIVYDALKNMKIFAGYKAKNAKKIPELVRWLAACDTAFGNQVNELLVTCKKNTTSTYCLFKRKQQIEEIKEHPERFPKMNPMLLQSEYELWIPNVEWGKVVTRFPPEPSGYLHIGHAKAALLNNYFARKFEGKLILRFDDTNPEKEKKEYEDAIQEDLERIGVVPDCLTYSSDHFGTVMNYCTQLIKEGKAFADDTPVEELRKEKLEGIESKNRDATIDWSLEKWEEMQKGSEVGKKFVIRLKIDMKSKNGCMRDPVIYRCKEMHHPRVGDKYKCYPTYDFSCPIVDAIEGVTHTLRTSEFNDRNDQYYFIADALKLRKPYIWDYARLTMTNSVMSKRKLTQLVNEKVVEGWDDPRFTTLRGLFRRGLCLDALCRFVLSQGTTKSSAVLKWDKLWAFNKQILDPIVPRFTAFEKSTLVPLECEEGSDKFFTTEMDGVKMEMVQKHLKNASIGNKAFYFTKTVYLNGEDAKSIKEGEEITLMRWGNAIITKIEKDAEGKVIKMKGILNLKGNFKTTEKKLTWLPKEDESKGISLCEFNHVEFDHLITKERLEADDDFMKFVNTDSKHKSQFIGEPAMKDLKVGDYLQLERAGYYRVDSVNPLTLFLIDKI